MASKVKPKVTVSVSRDFSVKVEDMWSRWCDEGVIDLCIDGFNLTLTRKDFATLKALVDRTSEVLRDGK